VKNQLFNKEVSMKKSVFIVVWIFALTGFGLSWAQEDVSKHPNCTYCGMDRAKFAHSRVLIEYDDGSTFGACSLHCAAIDMAVNIDKAPKAIYVGDYGNKKLIDAEKAIWVIGGDQMGIMTKRAKWAFENQADADSFTKGHGGELATFEQAIKASYEDMYQDTRMIREKRKMKRMKQKAGN
jgi:copper chaperone NosL